MKRIFPKPSKPEELYGFFTYGLALTPLRYAQHWNVNATLNSIKRRLWRVNITMHSTSIMIDYQPGVKADSAWYLPEWKY